MYVVCLFARYLEQRSGIHSGKVIFGITQPLVLLLQSLSSLKIDLNT